MNLVACHWCRMMPSLTSHIPVPRPSYTQARENLVKAIPPKILCLLACGGKDCRYEGPECWKANQQVIRGLFSSWWDIVSKHHHLTSTCCSRPSSTRRVTDDIVAMSRPSSHLIEKYSVIEQFRRLSLLTASPSGVSCDCIATALSPLFLGWTLDQSSTCSFQGNMLTVGPAWTQKVVSHTPHRSSWTTTVRSVYLIRTTCATWYGNINIISSVRACAYLCIFSIFLQLWDARLRSVVPRWHHWRSEGFGLCSERREGGRTLPCWFGQDRYSGLSSSPVWMLSCVFSVRCVCFPVRRSDRLLPGLHSPPQPQWGCPLRADQTTSLHPDPGADQPGVQLRSPARHAADPVPWPEPAAWCPVHPAALPESTGAAATRPGGTRAQIHAKGQDWTLVLFPWTQLAGLQNALSWPPGGVPPVCAAFLPGPGSSCSSRGPCRAGEEGSSEGSEQDGEGDPGDQTLPTPPKRKQQEFMGRVSDLLGWPLGMSGEEERAVGQ